MVVQIFPGRFMTGDIVAAGFAEHTGGVAVLLAGAGHCGDIFQFVGNMVVRVRRCTVFHLHIVAKGAGVSDLFIIHAGRSGSRRFLIIVLTGFAFLGPDFAAVFADEGLCALFGALCRVKFFKQRLVFVLAVIQRDGVFCNGVFIKARVVEHSDVKCTVLLGQTLNSEFALRIKVQTVQDLVEDRETVNLNRRFLRRGHVKRIECSAVGIDDLGANGGHFRNIQPAIALVLCVRIRLVGVGQRFDRPKLRLTAGGRIVTHKRRVFGSRMRFALHHGRCDVILHVVVVAADTDDLRLGVLIEGVGKRGVGHCLVQLFHFTVGLFKRCGVDQEVFVQHTTRDIIDGIIPCRVHIVVLAVQCDTQPAVAHTVGERTGHIGAVDAELLEHPAVRHGIALANSLAVHKRAVGVVGIGVRGQRYARVICSPCNQTVMHQQELVVNAHFGIALNAAQELEHHFFARVTLFGVLCPVTAVIDGGDDARLAFDTGRLNAQASNVQHLRHVVQRFADIVPAFFCVRNRAGCHINSRRRSEEDLVDRRIERVPVRFNGLRIIAVQLTRGFCDCIDVRRACGCRRKAGPHHQQAKQNGKDRSHFFHGSFLLKNSEGILIPNVSFLL